MWFMVDHYINPTRRGPLEHKCLNCSELVIFDVYLCLMKEKETCKLEGSVIHVVTPQSQLIEVESRPYACNVYSATRKEARKSTSVHLHVLLSWVKNQVYIVHVRSAQQGAFVRCLLLWPFLHFISVYNPKHNSSNSFWKLFQTSFLSPS